MRVDRANDPTLSVRTWINKSPTRQVGSIIRVCAELVSLRPGHNWGYIASSPRLSRATWYAGNQT